MFLLLCEAKPPKCLRLLCICIGAPTNNTHQSLTSNSPTLSDSSIIHESLLCCLNGASSSWRVNSLEGMCSSANTSAAWQFEHGNFTLFIQQRNKWLISFVFPFSCSFSSAIMTFFLHCMTVWRLSKPTKRDRLWIHFRWLSLFQNLFIFILKHCRQP